MDTDRQALIEDILAAQQIFARTIGAAMSSVWMNLDLSMAQLKTLMALYNGGAQPIGQIAEYLRVGQPTASHLVDRLVQAQFVGRTEDAQDRRRTLASLTPAGEALVQQITQVRLETLRHWLSQLDDDALAAFQYGISALAAVSAQETATQT
jgi:MarR family transcriptional regulator, organic hydroperoxide resistance regulator